MMRNRDVPGADLKGALVERRMPQVARIVGKPPASPRRPDIAPHQRHIKLARERTDMIRVPVGLGTEMVMHVDREDLAARGPSARDRGAGGKKHA